MPKGLPSPSQPKGPKSRVPEPWKVNRGLARRANAFQAAEHGEQPQQEQEEAQAAAAEQEQAAAQEEESQQEEAAQQEDQQKASLLKQAGSFLVEAAKSTAIRAALPYVVMAALALGLLFVVIVGLSGMKQGQENAPGPRPVDPVVAGKHTDEVGALLALASDAPASVELIEKRMTQIQTELKRLRELINKVKEEKPEIKQAKQNALAKLDAIENIINNKILVAVQKAKDAAKDDEGTRTKGNKKKLPVDITKEMKELKRLAGELRSELLKTAGSGGPKIAQVAQAEFDRGTFEGIGPNGYPRDNNPYYKDTGKRAPYAFGPGSDQHWCANFVSWVYKEAGYPELWNWADHKNVERVWVYMMQNHQVFIAGPPSKEGKSAGGLPFSSKKVTYSAKPQVGDMAFFNGGSGDGLDHIGLIWKVNGDGTVETIEGNYGQRVGTRHARLAYGEPNQIWRFARMGK